MKANCSERGILEIMPDVPMCTAFMSCHAGFYIGKGKETIEYLVKQGRVINKEKVLQKLDLIKNEEWTYIK